MNHWCQRDADLNKYCQSWLKSNGGYALGTREYYLMRRTARELNLLDHTILEQHEVPLKQTSP